MFQFSLGADPLPYETASRIRQNTLRELGEIIARHPKLNFQCHISSLHANQTLCTFCRELPNFSLAAYWWHNFFPMFIRQVIETRLDMLPVNKQIGFLSDAYCADWCVCQGGDGPQAVGQRAGAEDRAGTVRRKMALETARQIFFETPQSLCGMKPKIIEGR